MRRFALAAVAVLGLALCVSRTACAEDIDNTQYANWAKFKIGSFVKTVLEQESTGADKLHIEYTITLVELTKDKAVLETKTVTTMGSRPPGEPRVDKHDVPAKIKKPEEAKDPKKVGEGDETIDLGGKKVKCHWIEMNSEGDGTKNHSKSWFSDEIPGRLAKMETQSTGNIKATTKIWADKWEAK